MTLPCTAAWSKDKEPDTDSFLRDVRKGLAATPKRIPSKYFYDARGSALFEKICTLPEYYLTRVEQEILRTQAADMARAIGPRALVVEYGSGSAVKTQCLLAALSDPVAYMPIEISPSALNSSLHNLGAAFPNVEMLPLCADFTSALTLPRPQRDPLSVLIFFPGSTLGNFEPADASHLLQVMHAEMGPDGAALIGIDLQKDARVIEAAYNDSAGVTAEFTLNLLHRINRELGADFQVDQFVHQARYNPLAGRIETRIVSLREQSASLDGSRFHFAPGEKMLVEYSCKYSLPQFERMAARVGLRVTQTWTDPDRMFAVQLLRRA